MDGSIASKTSAVASAATRFAVRPRAFALAQGCRQPLDGGKYASSQILDRAPSSSLFSRTIDRGMRGFVVDSCKRFRRVDAKRLRQQRNVLSNQKRRGSANSTSLFRFWFQQLCGVYLQELCELPHCVNCDVEFAALNLTDIGAVKAGDVSQAFLRIASCNPYALQVGRNPLSRFVGLGDYFRHAR